MWLHSMCHWNNPIDSVCMCVCVCTNVSSVNVRMQEINPIKQLNNELQQSHFNWRGGALTCSETHIDESEKPRNFNCMLSIGWTELYGNKVVIAVSHCHKTRDVVMLSYMMMCMSNMSIQICYALISGRQNNFFPSPTSSSLCFVLSTKQIESPPLS